MKDVSVADDLQWRRNVVLVELSGAQSLREGHGVVEMVGSPLCDGVQSDVAFQGACHPVADAYPPRFCCPFGRTAQSTMQ